MIVIIVADELPLFHNVKSAISKVVSNYPIVVSIMIIEIVR